MLKATEGLFKNVDDHLGLDGDGESGGAAAKVGLGGLDGSVDYGASGLPSITAAAAAALHSPTGVVRGGRPSPVQGSRPGGMGNTAHRSRGVADVAEALMRRRRASRGGGSAAPEAPTPPQPDNGTSEQRRHSFSTAPARIRRLSLPHPPTKQNFDPAAPSTRTTSGRRRRPSLNEARKVRRSSDADFATFLAAFKGRQALSQSSGGGDGVGTSGGTNTGEGGKAAQPLQERHTWGPGGGALADLSPVGEIDEDVSHESGGGGGGGGGQEGKGGKGSRWGRAEGTGAGGRGNKAVSRTMSQRMSGSSRNTWDMQRTKGRGGESRNDQTRRSSPHRANTNTRTDSKRTDTTTDTSTAWGKAVQDVRQTVRHIKAQRALLTHMVLILGTGQWAAALNRVRRKRAVDTEREACTHRLGDALTRLWRRRKVRRETARMAAIVAVLRRHLWHLVLRAKSRRRRKQATVLRHVLTRSTVMSTAWVLVHQFRWRLVRCQRLVRGYLQCRAARLEALTLIWCAIEDTNNMRPWREKATKQLEKDKSFLEMAVDESRGEISGLLDQWRTTFKGFKSIVQIADPQTLERVDAQRHRRTHRRGGMASLINGNGGGKWKSFTPISSMASPLSFSNALSSAPPTPSSSRSSSPSRTSSRTPSRTSSMRGERTTSGRVGSRRGGEEGGSDAFAAMRKRATAKNATGCVKERWENRERERDENEGMGLY